MKVQVAVLAVALLELVDLEFLPRKSADHADTGEILLEHGGHRALGLVGRLE